MNVRVPQVVLPADLAQYRDQRPKKDQRRSAKIDGSGMELQIVSVLKREGASDDEVFAYFDHHELPRYVEEGRSRAWLQSLIRTSSESTKSKTTNLEEQHLRVLENEHNSSEDEKQSYRDGLLVHFVLRRRVQQEEDGHIPILTELEQPARPLENRVTEIHAWSSQVQNVDRASAELLSEWSCTLTGSVLTARRSE